jgi:hypothetical protein
MRKQLIATLLIQRLHVKMDVDLLAKHLQYDLFLVRLSQPFTEKHEGVLGKTLRCRILKTIVNVQVDVHEMHPRPSSTKRR